MDCIYCGMFQFSRVVLCFEEILLAGIDRPGGGVEVLTDNDYTAHNVAQSRSSGGLRDCK